MVRIFLKKWEPYIHTYTQFHSTKKYEKKAPTKKSLNEDQLKEPIREVVELIRRTHLYHKITAVTLPETNSKFAPENRPGPKRKGSYSKHWFSGTMLVSRRVTGNHFYWEPLTHHLSNWRWPRQPNDAILKHQHLPTSVEKLDFCWTSKCLKHKNMSGKLVEMKAKKNVASKKHVH